MPNFVPMRDYTMSMIDELIDTYHLRPPFIDVGCGQGDVSLHLTRRHGWDGVAVDSSVGAAAAARSALRGTGVAVLERPLDEIQGVFNTVVLSTVIEHIADDRAAVARLRHLLPAEPGAGHLVMSMPTNPDAEWRWDDDFYGHYRRYTRQSVDHLLSASGFRLVEFWDYTFPVFWAMRRTYTRLLPARQPVAEVKETNTADSSLNSAWDVGTSSNLATKVPVWGLVNKAQRRFRNTDRGFEAICLAVTT